jgi:hypothetical protein
MGNSGLSSTRLTAVYGIISIYIISRYTLEILVNFQGILLFRQHSYDFRVSLARGTNELGTTIVT